MNRIAFTSIVSLLGLAFSASSIAAKPEDAIKYRQGVMVAQGWNFGAIAAMIKGEKPYGKAAFAKRAENLAALSKMSLEGFTIEGSDKGKTKAKPEIWEKMNKFKGGTEKLAAETAKLSQVAQCDDMGAIKAQFNETAKV